MTEPSDWSAMWHTPSSRPQRFQAVSPSPSKNGHGDDTGPVARSCSSAVPPASHQPTTKRNERNGRRQRTSASSLDKPTRSSPGQRQPQHTPAYAALPADSHVRQRRPQQQQQQQSGHYQPRHRQPTHRTSNTESPKPVLGDGRHRKQDISHLLNFTVGHDSTHDDLPSMYGGGYGNSHGTKRRTRHNFYNKQQFLLANCQFIVKEGNYSEFTSSHDPDRLVNWDAIQQVRLLCHEEPSCPICLSPPRAAKITRCGHIYCWPCILQYLEYLNEDEKSGRKCPICHEVVHKVDLKSVGVVSTQPVSLHDEVTFRLVKRDDMSAMVTPQLTAQEQLTGDEVERFTKLLPFSDDCILARIVTQELADLTNMLSELEHDAGSELQLAFTTQAMHLCKEQEKQLKSHQQRHAPKRQALTPAAHNPAVEPPVYKSTSPLSPQPPKQQSPPSADDMQLARQRVWDDITADSPVSESTPPPMPAADDSDSAAVATASCEDEATASASPEVIGVGVDTSSPAESVSDSVLSGQGAIVDTAHYLFQADDGQHVYLHPFTSRLLKQDFPDLRSAPLTITGSILELEQHSMTDELRRRYRYLSHLPLSCEFTLCQLDLKPPLLSEATIAMFAEDIEKRKQKRQRRKREEEKERRRAQAKARAASNSSGYQNPLYKTQQSSEPIGIPAHHDNADFVAGDFPAELGSADSSVSSPTTSQPSSLQEGTTASLLSDTTPGVSHFSYSHVTNPSVAPTAAGTGSSPSSNVWPTPQSSNSFAAALRSSDGQASASALTQPRRGTGRSTAGGAQSKGLSTGDGSDSEECYVPSFQDSFTDALVGNIDAALASVAASTQGATSPAPTGTGGKKGKKGRKKQQVLLFSTSSRQGQ